MLSKHKIEDSGDTDLLPGGPYGKFEIKEATEAEAAGGEPLQGQQDSARYNEGVPGYQLIPLSILPGDHQSPDDAAIKGKNDRLVGLKENIIFRLILLNRNEEIQEYRT
ncbi:MAG: hypothetical protein ACLTK0_05630 [Anaerovoracaceae bacterium]